MVFGLAYFLSLLVLNMAVPASKVDDVVSGTGQVIGELQKEGVDAKRFANVSMFDGELDKIGQKAEADFDMTLYKQKKEDFAKLAQRSMDASKKSESEKNKTIAEEKLEEAEEAQKDMTKADNEIEAMEMALHDTLQKALVGKLKPELAIADKFSGQASHLQEEAHSMMDPLYGWGDAAEDKADGLNDQTNDALSIVEKIVRAYRRHILDHSRTLQRNTERKLFRPSQDRGAISRKVRRAMHSASGHLAVQQYLATTGLLGLPLGSTGGMTLLLALMFAAAAVGGLVVSLLAKSRKPRDSEYQQLSA
jgi:hypothetical protein